MCVIYVLEQNVKESSSYVYHRLYFTHKLKNPIIKPHRKISKEPAANYSSGFWRQISIILLHVASFFFFLLYKKRKEIEYKKNIASYIVWGFFLLLLLIV